MLKLKDGRSILLSNTLYVTELGCNLLSVKKMVTGNSNLGQISSNRIVFINIHSKSNLIMAENYRGLYITSNISDDANGQIFDNAEMIPEMYQNRLILKIMVCLNHSKQWRTSRF